MQEVRVVSIVMFFVILIPTCACVDKIEHGDVVDVSARGLQHDARRQLQNETSRLTLANLF